MLGPKSKLFEELLISLNTSEDTRGVGQGGSSKSQSRAAFFPPRPSLSHPNRKAVNLGLTISRGSATEHVLYFKCHRKYYTGSASENTDLDIFCDTCLQWEFHYSIL